MARYDVRQENRLINEIMELLVTHHGGELSEEELDREIDLLQHAIEIARSSHCGQFRKSGEAYFFHPLRVAHLASRHWMDFASITAAILHDVVEDTPVTLGEVESAFGPEVALLVNGLTKVTEQKLSREALKAKTYRKTLLLALKDVRVLCLKFWDRIDNLQTISALNPHKQSLIAEETRTVYVPLARHLGMGHVASQLDSLSLAILHPRKAARYHEALAELKKQVQPHLRSVRSSIHTALKHHKVSAMIKDHWRLFCENGTELLKRGMTTLYTMEVQVDRTMDAYLALGVLHSVFPPIPGKLRDHLNVPSQFGYQALKTTVQAGEYRMRVQITTRKLARFNDAGVLAPGFEFRRANFQDLMGSLLDGESAFDTEGLRLASATIQVYTPNGDIRTLPEGSCVLDFAFNIHEDMGLTACRARVNGKTRLLKSRLMDGDQVEIECAPTPEALPKWLEWAVTPKARNAIRRYLRNSVRKEMGEDG